MTQHDDHTETGGHSSSPKTLSWSDVTGLAINGNPPPPRRVEKTEAQ